MSIAKTTRIAQGIYDVLVAGVRYEVEQYPDGAWLTFQPSPHEGAPRQFLNDYRTKRDAIRSLIEAADAR